MVPMLAVVGAVIAIGFAVVVWRARRRAKHRWPREFCPSCLCEVIDRPLPEGWNAGGGSSYPHRRCQFCGTMLFERLSPDLPPMPGRPVADVGPAKPVTERFALSSAPDEVILELVFTPPAALGEQGRVEERPFGAVGETWAAECRRAIFGERILPKTSVPPPFLRGAGQFREAVMRAYILSELDIEWLDIPDGTPKEWGRIFRDKYRANETARVPIQLSLLEDAG